MSFVTIPHSNIQVKIFVFIKLLIFLNFGIFSFVNSRRPAIYFSLFFYLRWMRNGLIKSRQLMSMILRVNRMINIDLRKCLNWVRYESVKITRWHLLFIVLRLFLPVSLFLIRSSFHFVFSSFIFNYHWIIFWMFLLTAVYYYVFRGVTSSFSF